MTTELILATLTNLQGLFVVIAVVSLLATVHTHFMVSDQSSTGEELVYSSLKPWPRRFVVAALIFGALACIPTPNDLWHARIALVKFELASPENVKKGTERIDAIAKALECKYLNNCEEKKQ